jgi:hypothetical protein
MNTVASENHPCHETLAIDAVPEQNKNKRKKMPLRRPFGQVFSHPVVATYTMANSSVVKLALHMCSLLVAEAALLQLAYAVANPFVLGFALWIVSYGF